MRDFLGRSLGELIVFLVGLFICTGILAGGFLLGRWASPYLGWPVSDEVLGMLTALSVIWMWERQDAQSRYQRLMEQLTRSRTDETDATD